MVPPSMICMSIYFSRYITIICSVAFSYISGRFAVNFSPQWGQRKWSCSVVSYSLCLMNCSPPGSSIHGIFQARVLGWVAISFSRGSSPTQGSNLGLLYCRQTLYHLSHQGRPYHHCRWHQIWPFMITITQHLFFKHPYSQKVLWLPRIPRYNSVGSDLKA